jgi:fructose/tagatose bisphosphate aldolase
MKTLREVLEEAERSRVAVGHFNISDLIMLKAVVESAQELNAPVLVGFQRVSATSWVCARLRHSFAASAMNRACRSS